MTDTPTHEQWCSNFKNAGGCNCSQLTDRTLYREANTKGKDREAWYDGKAKHMWVVPVVPCKHGNVNPHGGIESFTASDGMPGMRYFECDGKPEADDDT